MKKLFGKLVAVALVVTMMCGLVACGSKEDTKKEDNKKLDKIVLGTSADYPPFEFIILDENKKQQYAGIDISMAEQIAKDMDTKLEVSNMNFDSLMAALQKGEDFLSSPFLFIHLNYISLPSSLLTLGLQT